MIVVAINRKVFKRAWSRNVNKLPSKRRFCSILDRPYHRDFPLFSQNEGVILKVDSFR